MVKKDGHRRGMGSCWRAAWLCPPFGLWVLPGRADWTIQVALPLGRDVVVEPGLVERVGWEGWLGALPGERLGG